MPLEDLPALFAAGRITKGELYAQLTSSRPLDPTKLLWLFRDDPTALSGLLEWLRAVDAGATMFGSAGSVDSVGDDPSCVTSDTMPAQHTRIDPTPAGAVLSLSELLATVVEARPFPDAPEGTFELLDASGTRLGTTTEETAQRLWPTKLYDHGSPEHVKLSAAVDAALSSGDPDELAAATDKLKLVRPPKS